MRRPPIRTSEHFYYVTARSQDERGFYLSVSEMEGILQKRLRELELEFKLEILIFLVKEDRFHLIIRFPAEPINRVMYFFMKDTTRTIQKRTGRINHIYGSGYKSSLLLGTREIEAVKLYIMESEKMGPEEIASIASGLKKEVFQFKKNRSNRLIIPGILLTHESQKSHLEPNSNFPARESFSPGRVWTWTLNSMT